MAHKRILFLGPTGVRKKQAAKRLSERISERAGIAFRFCNFEDEYLKARVGNWPTFLGQDRNLQSERWNTCWADFVRGLTNDVTILGLHATYVSGPAGLRCPISIPQICEGFQPTLIITLIDDVYSMWRVTETRADGRYSAGRPNLEQLLTARRAEILLGDVIASHTQSPTVRHLVIATENSIDCLVNAILFDAKLTYLSFPISATREMVGSGNSSFVDLINEAHKKADAIMVQDGKRAFVSPLSIDELPFALKAEHVAAGRKIEELEEEAFEFCPSERWGLSQVWSQSCIVDQQAGSYEYRLKDAVSVAGLIRSDVGLRDRRLVSQAKSLAVVCPKPPNEDRITRGVKEEIEVAIPQGIECYIWQKSEWDPQGFVDRQFPKAGSMGMGYSQMMIERVACLDDLLQRS